MAVVRLGEEVRGHRVRGGDAGRKPAPDVYLEACRRLGVDPSDAVAFEDSPRGVTAAGRAGLMVIGVTHANGRRLQADLVVSAFDDPRLASIFGLPASTAVP